MRLDTVKSGVESLWGQVAEGWRHLIRSASGALTRFRPSREAGLPAAAEVDDDAYLPDFSWAMLGGDVFEDERRVVVRLEVPGMEKSDFGIEVTDDALRVSGEKRFRREGGDGRWRAVQCAYGSFRRTVPLPAAVIADQAKATYRDGVLRVELPKARPGKPAVRAIPVH